MVVVAISDVHLGAQESNVKPFKSFLSFIERMGMSDLVILGDFVDMWRSDVSGLFLKNYEIVQSLMRMKENHVNIHYVVGNHDFHLLQLKGYPLEFKKSLPMPINGVNYIFKHGYDFDRVQSTFWSEVLCYNLSDKSGKFRSKLWKLLIKLFLKRKIAKEIGPEIETTDAIIFKSILDNESLQIKYLENLMKSPNERKTIEEMGLGFESKIANPLKNTEENAAASVHNGEILIFGHTHRPFVNDNRQLFNTGSWMSNDETPNTYIVIEGKNVKLMQYDDVVNRGNDITNDKIKHYKIINS